MALSSIFGPIDRRTRPHRTDLWLVSQWPFAVERGLNGLQFRAKMLRPKMFRYK
jgi:hypothetical protein